MPISERPTKGGEFLIEETQADKVFTPEDFSEEQRQLADTIDHFMAREVLPNAEQIENHDFFLVDHLLIEDNLLDAVIGLPANLFPTTSIPVAILVFDRARERGGTREACQDVLYIDASREFQAANTQNALLDSQLDKIVATQGARRDVDKYAHVAPLSEIAENDFNLNIPRYVDTFEEEEEIDVAAVEQEIERLEAELVEVRARMKQYLKELGV